MHNIATPAAWCRSMSPEGSDAKTEQSQHSRYSSALAGLVRHLPLLGVAIDVREALAEVLRRVVLAQEAGHACVPLACLPGALRNLHVSSPIVCVEPGAGAVPAQSLLVIDNAQVYLPRTRDFEARFAAVIRRLSGAADPPNTGADLLSKLATTLNLNAGQQRAVQTALQQRLCVITGGPGTGKTTCLSAILALLLATNPGARIALAAPTGKAAARMQEALSRGLDALSAQPWFTPELRARVPQAVTVHRLLRLSPQHRTPYGQGAGQTPLPFDCVVVDESSMLDLALATRLVCALQTSARLVLLGDSAQLAAVEHGVAFHALCESAHLQPSTGQSCVVRLTQSWRFDAASTIGQLARSIEASDAQALNAALESMLAAAINAKDKWALVSRLYQFFAIDNDEGASIWQQSDNLAEQLYAHFSEFRAALASNAAPLAVLAAFAQFQVLAAVNGGPYGTEVLNAALAALHRASSGGLAASEWFHGRPVLVLHNQPLLGLANGDVGIVLQTAQGLVAVFARTDAPGGVLSIAVEQLPEVSDAYVLTVHKAQGSEFEHVAFVLPPRLGGDSQSSHPVSRELLYTAVTRAKSRISLYANRADVLAAAATSVKRQHGLEARLCWLQEN